MKKQLAIKKKHGQFLSLNSFDVTEIHVRLRCHSIVRHCKVTGVTGLNECGLTIFSPNSSLDHLRRWSCVNCKIKDGIKQCLF